LEPAPSEEFRQVAHQKKGPPTPEAEPSTHERPKPASAAAALAARPGKPVPCRPPRAFAALPTVFGSELEPGLPAQLMLPMVAVAESLGLVLH